MITTQPQISAWRASILAGIITALIASAFAILLQIEQPMMYIPAILLVGAGPIIGYALAAGRLAILPLIGSIIGIVGHILSILSILLILLVGAGTIVEYVLAVTQIAISPLIIGVVTILLLLISLFIWPLFVGILSREHRIGRLYLGSLIGFILGFAVLAVIALSEFGQNPVWLSAGYVALFAIWGGTCGAFMATRRKQLA